MLRPVPHQIIEPFGSMTDERRALGLPAHRGIDLAAPLGTVVTAPFAGAATTGQDDGVGNFVIITGAYRNGRDRLWFKAHLYHLSKITVSNGQKVEAGMDVGFVGNTGRLITAPHLHLGLQRLVGGGWCWVDPEEYL